MLDCIIIGNGPAGVSAALYTRRANLDTLVIGKDDGALSRADKIENYYGFPGGISGKKLIELGLEQLKDIDVKYINEEVVAIRNDESVFSVITNKNEYKSKSVIIATGANRVAPKIEGIKEYEGRGVSYCAICDAFFFKDKDVAVLGNGEYAIHEIGELLPIVNTVNVLTNGKEKITLRADRVNVCDKNIKRLSGNDRLEKVEFEDDTSIAVSVVFVAEGVASSIDFARRIGAIVEGNNIVVDRNYMTNIPGLFAAGDAIGGLHQISKSVSDGAKAGISAINYVRKNK